MDDIELRIVPGLGVAPLHFGMTEAQARTASTAWNTPVTSDGGSSSLRVRDEHLTMDVFVNFEASDRVTSFEVWRPEVTDETRRVTVRLGDLLLLDHDADDVLRRLRSDGYTIDESEPYHPIAVNDQLSLGLNREGGEDADDAGMAPIFRSVLVAPAGYYDPPPR